MSKRLLRELLKRESLAEKLLKTVDDYEIYCTLVGHDVELGETISSPIRASDDFPSFALYVPTRLIERGFDIRPEEIWFKDLADGRYGDVFRFVQFYAAHHFNLQLENRYEVIKFIDEQLEIGLFSKSGPKRIASKRNFEAHTTSNLYYKSRKFTTRDLDYWGTLCQSEDDLKFWGVKSIKSLLDEDGYIRKEFRKNELAFVYEFFDKEKLYQPEAPRSFKFRNTCPGDDYHYYQGYEQLRGKQNEVNNLIITKSYKDVMVFYKFFNEFLNIPTDIVAPHAESINLSPKFVEGVKNNYDNILCVSDFDLAGVKFANKCKKLGFDYKFIDTKRVNINGKLKVLDKDISDFLTNNGKEDTIEFLKSWKLKNT
jgi:hypothetical protein